VRRVHGNDSADYIEQIGKPGYVMREISHIVEVQLRQKTNEPDKVAPCMAACCVRVVVKMCRACLDRAVRGLSVIDLINVDDIIVEKL